MHRYLAAVGRDPAVFRQSNADLGRRLRGRLVEQVVLARMIDGYLPGPVRFRGMAHALWTTEETVERLGG